MEIYNSDNSTLNKLVKNSEFLRLFRQMSFMIHRNTYGGLNMHDLEALDSIKKCLASKLQKDERDYLTKMIDSLSIYELPDAVDAEVVDKLVENDFFKFVSSQDEMDLCEILIEHSPPNNALMLSIEVSEEALALVTELVEYAREGSPDKITNPLVATCNIWEKIKNADDLPNNHINIVFFNKNNERSSFLCYKGLCMARQYLEDIQVKEVPKERKEKVRKKFAPNFGYGIVSLAKRIVGGGLSSDVMMVSEVKEADKAQDTSDNDAPKEVFTETTGEVVKAGESEPETITTNLKGRGVYDIEQGFLFSIT